MSIGSGLESMLKDGPKDSTLKRFCSSNSKYQQINPEDNTVENTDNEFHYKYRDSGQTNDEDEENDEDGDKNVDTDQSLPGRPVSPNEIRKKLFEERRKSFARRWFTKHNYYQKMREQKEISKRGRSSSGIGEERVMQMEIAKSMSTRARKRGRVGV